MKFQYQSEEDAKRDMLLPAGVYDFEILTAEERLSKKGNPMIALKLKIFSDRGERFVNDYLMEAMRFKLIHFAQAAGLWKRYEAGEMTAEELVGRTGRVELIQETQEGYSPRNSVKDYVAVAERPAPTGGYTVTAAPPRAPKPLPVPADAGDEPPF